jgi:hypothetical protein
MSRRATENASVKARCRNKMSGYANHKPASADHLSGSDNHKPDICSESQQQTREHCTLRYRTLGKITSSLGTLLVHLDIIATTYDNMTFYTCVFSLYSYPLISVSIYLCIYIAPHRYMLYLHRLHVMRLEISMCVWR